MPVILAAPGTGKPYWAAKHKKWEDMDEWAKMRGLHSEAWHGVYHTDAETAEHYRHIDSQLEMLPVDTFLIGALYWDFIPDAIVLLDPKIHRERVDRRHDLKWEDVGKVVADLEEKAVEYGVATFGSFDEAAKWIDAKNPAGLFRDLPMHK